MDKSIGMVEIKSVASGIKACDLMLKSAEIDIIESQTVCPGKYIIIISGLLSSVKAAISIIEKEFSTDLIDKFVLGNPHKNIFSALYGTTSVHKPDALGVLETYSAASIIVAADEACKSAIVDLIEIRIARGMCGKSYFLLTGEISSVEASIEKAADSCKDSGMLLNSTIIANPDPKLWKTIW